MARREWGLLCPEGHGLLLERPEWTDKGVVWCPSAEHSGNGRFWRRNEVEEGWFVHGEAPTVSQAYLDRQAAAAERSAEWHAELDRHNKEKRMAKATATAEPKPKAGKEPRNCLCGCGGQTKGGRFLPGHDARYHARIKILTATGMSHDEAEKLASKGPLPAKYTAKPDNGKATPAPKATAKGGKAKAPDLTSKASDEDEAEEGGDDIAV